MDKTHTRTLTYKDIIKADPCGTYLLWGCRRAGKSQTIRSLLLEKGLLGDWSDIVYVFCQSINRNTYISAGIDEKYIFSECSPEIINNIMEQQKINKLEHNQLLNITIIIDDLLGSRRAKAKLEPIIENLFSVCRHFSISCVLAIQSYRFVSFLFQNTDFLFIYPRSIRKTSQKEMLKKEILSNYTDDQNKLDKILKNDLWEFTFIHLTALEDDFDKLCMKGKVSKKIVNFKI